MADNGLKIWQNNLLPNPSHMVDAKFDLVLKPISHGNPAMPFQKLCRNGTFGVVNFIEFKLKNIQRT